MDWARRVKKTNHRDTEAHRKHREDVATLRVSLCFLCASVSLWFNYLQPALRAALFACYKADALVPTLQEQNGRVLYGPAIQAVCPGGCAAGRLGRAGATTACRV